LLARLLFPATLGFNLYVLTPFPVAALGAFVWFRRHGSDSAAALGALAFAISGPVLSTGGFPNYSWALAFVPWALAGVDDLVHERRRRGFVVTAVAFGLVVGASELATLAGAGTLALGYALAMPASSVRSVLRRAALTLGAQTAGLALAAVQLFPAAAAYAGSIRARGLSAVVANTCSLHPLSIVESLAPQLFGDYTRAGVFLPWHPVFQIYLPSLYVGPCLVAIALVAVGARGSSRWVRFWIAVFVASLLVALGVWTPGAPIPPKRDSPPRLDPGPGEVHGVRRPRPRSARRIGMGRARSRRSSASARGRRLATAFAGLIAIAAAGVFVVAIIGPMWTRELWLGVAGRLGAPDPAAAAAVVLKSLTLALPRTAAIAAAVAVCIRLTTSDARSARLARWALFAALVVDLGVANRHLNPTIDVSLVGRPAWLDVLAAHPGDRLYVGGRAGQMVLQPRRLRRCGPDQRLFDGRAHSGRVERERERALREPSVGVACPRIDLVRRDRVVLDGVLACRRASPPRRPGDGVSVLTAHGRSVLPDRAAARRGLPPADAPPGLGPDRAL
jgi:hypothetical protein